MFVYTYILDGLKFDNLRRKQEAKANHHIIVELIKRDPN